MDEDRELFGGRSFVSVQQAQTGTVAGEQQTDVQHSSGALGPGAEEGAHLCEFPRTVARNEHEMASWD
jgi:hypothetical protein